MVPVIKPSELIFTVAEAVTLLDNATPSASTAVGGEKVRVGADLKFFCCGPVISTSAILVAFAFAGTVANNSLNPPPLFDIVIASTSNSPFDVKPIVATGVVLEPSAVPLKETYNELPL